VSGIGTKTDLRNSIRPPSKKETTKQKLIKNIMTTPKNKKLLLYLSLLFLPALLMAQQKAEHLIVITTDGFRWQELFTGMDSALANQEKYNQGDSAELFKKYWNENAVERRKLLMPFFWKSLMAKGQVYGNRNYGNYVNTSNPYRFSYPGYNEIFTGNPDTSINSNEYPDNPQKNVLEWLNGQRDYKGKVGAFTAWEAFNRILNEKRSGVPVIAAFDTTPGIGLTRQQLMLNKMLLNSYKPWGEGECLDVFTHYAAMEHLKTNRPKVLYISYGETDEWAHSGQYRDYLNAAYQLDTWLKELWSFIQNDPIYKNKTALLITVDHGRGLNDEWTKHGKTIIGADEIWFAIVAPGIPVKGEVKTSLQLYQQQLAQTMANLLGKQFKANHPVAEGLMKVLR
jgi:hypothetical protein